MHFFESARQLSERLKLLKKKQSKKATLSWKIFPTLHLRCFVLRHHHIVASYRSQENETKGLKRNELTLIVLYVGWTKRARLNIEIRTIRIL